MGTVFINDLRFDEVEVSAESASNTEIDNGHKGGVVQLHISPEDYGDTPEIMRYSPEQARRLAEVLILAADKAESL